MTRAPTDRSHLSIGEVLSLLQDEFPDVTISKIRFLEAQGLLDPERTPSGYRKFYDADVDRLRYILREQKENYLPLRVIKDRLDETGPVRTAPTAAGPTGHDDDHPVDRQNGVTAVALDDRPTRAEAPVAASDEPAVAPAARAAEAPAAPRPRPDPAPVRAEPARVQSARTAPARAEPVRAEPARTDVAEVIEAPARGRPSTDDATLQLGRAAAPRTAAPAPGDGSVSLTADELAQASGLSMRAVRELEGYGLLECHVVGDTSYYDADALVIARTAAGFLEHGIEARHIRSYKVAAEREAGLYEQIVLPLLKQRNPDARRRATQTVTELVRLGDEMRSVLLRRGLRDHIPPA